MTSETAFGTGRSRPRVLMGPDCAGLVYSEEDKGHFRPGVILRAGTQGIQGYIVLCHGLSFHGRSIALLKIDCQGLVARLTQNTVILTTAVELGIRWRELAEKAARLTKAQIDGYEAPHKGKNGEVGTEPSKGAVVRGLDTADQDHGGYQHGYPSPCTFKCSKIIMKTEGKRKRLSPQPGSPALCFTLAFSASVTRYFPQHGHPNA
ncbi:UNVERIFIED_CONTAM: hypothetical protein FKN15_071365 [Acipenser sinensis]